MFLFSTSPTRVIPTSAQVQAESLQNASPGGEGSACAPHSGKPPAIPGVREREQRGQGVKDVCQGNGPQLPLSRDWR